MTEALRSTHEDLIRQLRPDAQQFESLDAGEINDAILVDETEVFRFPKKEQDRQTLRYEAAVLRKLAGKLTLQIPEVHEVAGDGSYAAYSYVPGQMFTSEAILALTSAQKLQMAKVIADSMREINAALTIDEVAQLEKQYIPWRADKDTYYESKLNLGVATVHEVYAQQYEKFRQRRSQVGMPRAMVIYGDFHYGNLLFADEGELTGLIDFADCGPGTAVNDLRQLYRLGEDIVRAVMAELNGEFGEIDIELVRLNAILHELTVLMRPESQPPLVNPRAELAHKLLSEWLGDNWGEL